MMTNYLFIAAVILFAALIIRGYRKGFLRIVVYFIGMIFIIVSVKKISPTVSQYLMDNTSAYTDIKGKISDTLKEKNEIFDNTVEENQKLTIESYDMPQLLKTNLLINNTAEMYKTLLVSMFEDYVSSYLAKTAVNALSFIGLFVILWIAFRVVLSLCNLISKIPIIKGINKMAGALLGLVEALFVSWIFFFIVIVFMGNEVGNKMMIMVNQSQFLQTLFNSNILFSIVS